MAINFPSSPTDGQTFVSGAVRYTYSTAASAWSAAPLGTALPFNYVVNPIPIISQQNGSTMGQTSGYYVADQWFVNGSLVANIRSNMSSNAGPHGSRGVIYHNTYSSQKPTLAAGDYFSLTQTIEGNRTAPFQWGTASAKPAVLRFWVSMYAGTIGVGVRNAAAARSYTTAVTIPTTGSTEVAVAIPGDTTGTWPTDTSGGIQIWITYACGTTLITAPNVWTAGNFIAPTGISNFAAAWNSIFVSDFGLYLDPLNTGRAPPWQANDERTDLVDCLRYWYRMETGRGVTTGATGFARVGAAHPVTMRTGPAYALVSPVTIHDIGTNNAMTAVSSGYPSLWHAEIETTGSGLTAGRAGLMLTDDAAGYVAVSARM